MLKSYSSSFGYVKYAVIDGYDGMTEEFSLKSRKRITKKFIIQGVDGFLADAPNDQVPAFSLFGADSRGVERIMLGPTSFINHDCQPNARFVCGGETRCQTVVRVETLRELQPDEEIFVFYGDNYFGENNLDCRCATCLNRIFHQYTNAPDSCEPVRPKLCPETERPDPREAQRPGTDEVTQHKLAEAETPDPDEAQRPQSAGATRLDLNSKQPSDKSTQSRAKLDEVTQCLICETKAKRIDKHLTQCHPELSKDEIVHLKDFLRFRRLNANTKVYFCNGHGRMFSDTYAHKRHFKCDMANTTLVPNFKSKRCLPMALRLKLRNTCMPREDHLDLVTSFVNQEYRLKGA